MSIKFGDNSSFKGNSTTSFIYGGDSFTKQKEFEHELRRIYPSENDPERPPKWEPGDKYTVCGTIVGLIVGGVSGAIGSRLFFGFGLFGLLGGIFPGGIIGAIIGDFIRKRRLKSKNLHNNNYSR